MMIHGLVLALTAFILYIRQADNTLPDSYAATKQLQQVTPTFVPYSPNRNG